jgi:hypothetical protein
MAARVFRRLVAVPATKATPSFEQRAAEYWSTERVAWLTNGKDDPFSPNKPGVPTLLRLLGLLNSDASLGDGALRKYKQINQIFLVSVFGTPSRAHMCVRFADCH